MTDDFGRDCCPEDLESVALMVKPTKLPDWGHAALKTPNQTKGLWPKTGASKKDLNDFGNVYDDTSVTFPDSFHYCACPISVMTIDNWIKSQEATINSGTNPWGGKPDETYSGLNGSTGKNCIGWAAEGIEAAGGKAPVNPDGWPLTVPNLPSTSSSGGSTGTKNCP